MKSHKYSSNSTSKYITAIQQPEDINYSNALRQLKDADEKILKMKKRFKAIQIKSQRGSSVLIDRANKSHLKDLIKEQNQKFRIEYLNLKTIQQERIKNLKEESERQKKINIEALKKKKIELIQQRIRNNSDMRSKSQQHAQKIKQFKEMMLNKKRMNCKQIYQRESKSREAVDNFRQSRIMEIKTERANQKNWILQILKSRQEEIQDLDQQQGFLTQQYNKIIKERAKRMDVLEDSAVTKKQHIRKRKSASTLQLDHNKSLQNKHIIIYH